MARSIPPWLSGVLEKLELERPQIVTTQDIAHICTELGLEVPPRIIASRLKERGWLSKTSQRGVWEFVPGEVAGIFPSQDPLIPIKAFEAAHPKEPAALTFQSAAWAHGLADRAPSRQEVAFKTLPKQKVPPGIRVLAFKWNVEPETVRGIDVLAPESILVHAAHRPNAVRSWESALEWLPDVAYEADWKKLRKELSERPSSTWAKAGYLLQGMRPDLSEKIASEFSPRGKVRFGTSEKPKRNDTRWGISDYVLPINPKELKAIT